MYYASIVYMKKLTSFFFSILLLASCAEEVIEVDADALNAGKEYFPLKAGSYVEYSVNQVLHKELVDDEFQNFFLRQEVASVDTSGQYPIYRLEISTKTKLTNEWVLDSVWTVRDEGSRLVQVENNVPFVKLIFPVQESLEWDGNRYNTLSIEEYEAINLNQPYDLGMESFDNTLTIIQKDNYTLIDKDSRMEVYAAGVGLIYKKKELFKYINDSQSPFYAKDSIIGGIFYEQALIGYGE